MGDLTTAIVDEFYEDLRSAARTDGKPLAVGTVPCTHCALHAALARAQDRPGPSKTLLTTQRHPKMNMSALSASYLPGVPAIRSPAALAELLAVADDWSPTGINQKMVRC